jgi:hypothetical protein
MSSARDRAKARARAAAEVSAAESKREMTFEQASLIHLAASAPSCVGEKII